MIIIRVELRLLGKFWYILGRWYSRSNKNKLFETGRPLRRQELGYFASHGVANENKSAKS